VLEIVLLRKPPLVEVLFHHEGGVELANATKSGGPNALGGRIRNMQQGQTRGGLNLVRQTVHRVGADDDEVGAAALQALRGLNHQCRRVRPTARMLKGLYLGKVERPDEAACGMKATQAIPHPFVDDPVAD